MAAVLSGLPSTLHALATGGDLFEPTRAAGSILWPGERADARLLPAAALVHGALSLGWGTALALSLPRRCEVLGGAAAGLAIAALDLGLIGRRFPRVEALPLGPQVADHIAFGAVAGAVLARIRSAGHG